MNLATGENCIGEREWYQFIQTGSPIFDTWVAFLAPDEESSDKTSTQRFLSWRRPRGCLWYPSPKAKSLEKKIMWYQTQEDLQKQKQMEVAGSSMITSTKASRPTILMVRNEPIIFFVLVLLLVVFDKTNITAVSSCSLQHCWLIHSVTGIANGCQRRFTHLPSPSGNHSATKLVSNMFFRSCKFPAWLC